MHTQLTEYQEKVLRNSYEGKTIYQLTGTNNILLDKYYLYPVKGKKYSLSQNKHGEHSINKDAFHKLLDEDLIQKRNNSSILPEFEITRKGLEQILGHTNFTAYQT